MAGLRLPSEEREFTIESNILEWLNLQAGVFAFKIETSGYYSKKLDMYRKRKSKFHIKGTSDILGLKNGKFFAIECKTKLGSISPHQKAFLEQVRKMGGKAAVCRSIDEAEVFLASF